MDNSTFEILYVRHTLPLADDALVGYYDFRSLCADYTHCGVSARLVVGTYALTMKYDRIEELVEMATYMIEKLCASSLESADDLREALVDIPSESKIYTWTFFCYAPSMPGIVLAAGEQNVQMYMIHKNHNADSSISITDEHRHGPVSLSLVNVLDVLRGFVNAYLDDLAATIPCIVSYDAYQECRRRASIGERA